MPRQQLPSSVLHNPAPQASLDRRRLQALERRIEVLERRLERQDVWLTTKQAQALIPCKTAKATYAWLYAHGVQRSGDGTILRSDILRVKRRPPTGRVMHPASLANLRKRGA